MCFHADGTLMFGKTLCLSRGLYPCVQFKGLLIHADCNLICTKTLLVFKRIITRWSMRTDCFFRRIVLLCSIKRGFFMQIITRLSIKLVSFFMRIVSFCSIKRVVFHAEYNPEFHKDCCFSCGVCTYFQQDALYFMRITTLCIIKRVVFLYAECNLFSQRPFVVLRMTPLGSINMVACSCAWQPYVQ